MHAIIFANGNITGSPNPLPPHDILVAADGGAGHCRRLGLVPDIVIGDLDSLSLTEAADLERAGARFIRHSPRKDETDLELALHHVLEQGADRVTILGALGGRWDMTFANLLLLAHPDFAGVDLRLIDGSQECFFLRGGETLKLAGNPGDIVSVIPLGGDAVGLTYRGLEWPLENATLPFGTPRGVSNVMKGKEASLALDEGVLVCIVDHKSQKEAS